MIRLQRVTFLALHDYLGLTTELTRSGDDRSQIPPTPRTHHQRPRSHTHPNLLPNIPSTSVDGLNIPDEDDDLNDDENYRSTESILKPSYISPALDQAGVTPTSDIINNKTKVESIETPVTTERTVSIPASALKRTTTFTGQRSMSVIESRQMKPDFEEAAARARVKNSLDTTFFEKHKISYPNVSNKRSSNSSAVKRRSSVSDVKLKLFLLLISYSYFLISLNMHICIQDHQDQEVIVLEVNIMNESMNQIFKLNGHKFEKL